MKTAILGTGNLGKSLVKGLVDSGNYQPSDFILTRRSVAKLDPLAQEGFKVTNDNAAAVQQSQVVIIAVLPFKRFIL